MNDNDMLQNSIDEKLGHLTEEKERQRERQKPKKGIIGLVIAIVFAAVMLIRIFL